MTREEFSRLAREAGVTDTDEMYAHVCRVQTRLREETEAERFARALSEMGSSLGITCAEAARACEHLSLALVKHLPPVLVKVSTDLRKATRFIDDV